MLGRKRERIGKEGRGRFIRRECQGDRWGGRGCREERGRMLGVRVLGRSCREEREGVLGRERVLGRKVWVLVRKGDSVGEKGKVLGRERVSGREGQKEKGNLSLLSLYHDSLSLLFTLNHLDSHYYRFIPFCSRIRFKKQMWT